MSGLKLLFLSTRAARPSFRYRVEQMLPFFERAGHRSEIQFLPANLLSRFMLYRSLSGFDAVIIQKRLLAPVELKLVRRWSRRLVFDLDDTLIFDRSGAVDRRRQSRFKAMAESTDLILCGNRYLANQAARWSHRVEILPTAIDTERFRPGLKSRVAGKVTIGWTGSRSSLRYLDLVLPVLAKLSGDIELKIIADSIEGLRLEQVGKVPWRFVPWTAETEVQETAEFDIGLMPLSNDDHAKGKCACKALQYMALGIPAVCSPVGANRELITDSKDGYLPQSLDDWQAVLQALSDDTGLRDQVGSAGRATVETRFSLREIAEQMVDLIERAAAGVELPISRFNGR